MIRQTNNEQQLLKQLKMHSSVLKIKLVLNYFLCHPQHTDTQTFTWTRPQSQPKLVLRYQEQSHTIKTEYLKSTYVVENHIN